jgi:Xaa-Pro aminopeptidase
MSSELERKTERVVAMLEAEGLDGVFLNTQHNFSWFTCGGSNGIDLSSANGAGFLFVTRSGDRYVIANNIEMPRLVAEELPEGSDFEPIEITWQAEKDPQAVLKSARSVSAGGDFGCDIGFPETRWIEPSIAGCRAQLTVEEIERFRGLGRDAGEALESVVERLDAGQTENQIARIVRDELAAREIFSVVTLVAADERITKYRHPVPTNNIWRDTLLIVTCARRSGLIANLSRMICAGTVPDDLQMRTEGAAFVNASLYDETTEGMTGSELYNIAARAYAKAGFTDEINKHHQGGACGYRPRDWVAHPDSDDVVRMNQAFAWNPSITGTKTEETGLLTDGGFEVITATRGFPKISTVIGDREYFSPGILSLSKGVSA